MAYKIVDVTSARKKWPREPHRRDDRTHVYFTILDCAGQPTKPSSAIAQSHLRKMIRTVFAKASMVYNGESTVWDAKAGCLSGCPLDNCNPGFIVDRNDPLNINATVVWDPAI